METDGAKVLKKLLNNRSKEKSGMSGKATENFKPSRDATVIDFIRILFLVFLKV